MDATLILTCAGVGLICFLLGLLVGGRRRGDARMIVQPSPLAPQQQWPHAPPQSQAASASSLAGGDPDGVNLQLGRDIHELLSAGNKIEAIRRVRERTGMGLKESKEAVERLEVLMKRLG